MRTIAHLMVASAILLVPTAASAFCGFYVAGAETELYNNATMVVMMRDGTRTVLSMQNDYQGPPENFALVVPVPVILHEENVKTLEDAVFDRVDKLAAPRLVEYWEQDPCQPIEPPVDRAASAVPAGRPAAEADDSAAPKVVIEAQFDVGEYEVVILSANDSSALDTWLRDNGYNIPDGAEPILRPYVEGGMKFFVAKVNVDKVEFEDGRAILSPLRFHYDSEEFSLPVRLGLLNSQGKQDLIVHILARNQRYEVANYENVTIPTNIDVADGVRKRFGEFYAALFDRTLEENPKAVVTEYAWQATNCDPCPGPVLSVSDLRTLGADVLPGLDVGEEQATLAIGRPQTTGPLQVHRVQQMVNMFRPSLQKCYQRAAGRGAAFTGTATARLTVGTDGTVTGTPRIEATGMDGALRACIAKELRSIRFPPGGGAGTTSVELPLSSTMQPANPGLIRGKLNSFVLTRLHARYSKSSLGEDLVFRPADAIVGGRERRGPDGELEHGARPASANNFQARYAIRHRWKGAIECDNPRRGIWGGPPAGQKGSTGPEAAQDLAFAPRGKAELPELVAQDIPELGVSSQLAAAAGAGASSSEEQEDPGESASGGAKADSDEDSSGCDCRIASASSAPLGALAPIALAVLGLLLRRRR